MTRAEARLLLSVGILDRSKGRVHGMCMRVLPDSRKYLKRGEKLGPLILKAARYDYHATRAVSLLEMSSAVNPKALAVHLADSLAERLLA